MYFKQRISNLAKKLPRKHRADDKAPIPKALIEAAAVARRDGIRKMPDALVGALGRHGLLDLAALDRDDLQRVQAHMICQKTSAELKARIAKLSPQELTALLDSLIREGKSK